MKFGMLGIATNTLTWVVLGNDIVGGLKGRADKKLWGTKYFLHSLANKAPEPGKETILWKEQQRRSGKQRLVWKEINQHTTIFRICSQINVPLNLISWPVDASRRQPLCHAGLMDCLSPHPGYLENHASWTNKRSPTGKGETEVSQIKSLWDWGDRSRCANPKASGFGSTTAIRDWSCQTFSILSSLLPSLSVQSAMILGTEPSLQKLIKILTHGLFSTNVQRVYFGKRRAVERGRLQNFRLNRDNKTLRLIKYKHENNSQRGESKWKGFFSPHIGT